MSKSTFPQNCRSVTLSRGYQSSHNTWVNTMRKNGASKHTRVWGRIKDTGANFIVEGWSLWENGANWVYEYGKDDPRPYHIPIWQLKEKYGLVGKK